ncbi:MAG: S8 family serine peptidase [Synechococcales cyanobacterium C42_A2020_086]|jgi:subtilisin family serine protease|nr:S8 family serine peptidase [Synechococcales cyanobacterium C42_A2020_086]
MVTKVTSKGDRAMRSQVARRNFTIDGRGIKIGVISDSFNALKRAARDITSGNLPGAGNPDRYTQPIRILKDLRRGSDEGRAMMQIIFDVAPGAELLFHTAYARSQVISERSFSRAITALARAGADIIVDDIGFATPVFQDGLTAQTVTRIVNRGIAYFSAAGNDGNRSYASPFRPGATFVYNGVLYEAHDFDPGSAIDLFQEVTLIPGARVEPLLTWDQPVGQVTDAMELLLLGTPQLPDAGGEVLRAAMSLSSGSTALPLKYFSFRANALQTAHLVIARRVDPLMTPPQFVKWLSTANNGDGTVIYQYVNDAEGGGGSTIYGQPNARGAIAVGAVRVSRTPVFGTRPPMLEDFSTQGGTPILFDAQGNRLAVPEIRQKPEIAAPNGTATTFGFFSGLNPFFGTSAAAPHAAAVAALMLQRAGGSRRLTPAQILAALQKSAIAIDPPGNFRSGAGLIQADAAVLNSFVAERRGTPAADRIHGRGVAENLFGLDGADWISGSAGFDAIYGGPQADRISGGAGNDYLLGEAGNDQLAGDAGADVLLGHAGADRLIGGNGRDLLAGGAGRNQLLGGAEADTFVLSREGLALIRDFQVGQDRLALTSGLNVNQLRFLERDGSTFIYQHQQLLAQLVGVSIERSRLDILTIAIQT